MIKQRQNQNQPKQNSNRNRQHNQQNQRPPINQNQSPQNMDVSQTTDILGNCREVLYGTNIPIPNQAPNHIEQVVQTQTLHNIPGIQNNAPGQDVCRPIVQPVNTAQHNGTIYQAYGGVNGSYGGQNGPYYTNQQSNGQATPDSGMPPWAATLCSQMNNIQLMLDGHSQRWQLIENNMTLQNQKLANMENKLSELSNIKQNLATTSLKVYSVENELHAMQRTMADNGVTIEQYSNIYDNIAENNNKTHRKVSDIETRVQQLEQKQCHTDENMQDANEKLTDVRWRSMRENLLFFGIEESDPLPVNGEDCEANIKYFIKHDMGIEKEMYFDRVHRLGRFNRRNVRPRPIVAKFTFFKDREMVRLAAPEALSGTRYGVSEQFPQEIEDKRKKLYGVAKRAKADKNNTVKFVRDKLFINGQLYKPDADVETTRRVNNDRHGPPYTYNDSTRNTDTRSYARGSNVTNRSWPNPRTGQNGSQTNNRVDEPQIATYNRFSALASDTPLNQQTATPLNQQTTRSTYGGRRKARSPLEEVATFKRHHYDGNSSTAETQIEIDMDNTQPPNYSQHSPSLLQAGSYMNNRQTPPPMEAMTLTPSPLVTLCDRTGVICGGEAQTHGHNVDSARVGSTD